MGRRKESKVFGLDHTDKSLQYSLCFLLWRTWVVLSLVTEAGKTIDSLHKLFLALGIFSFLSFSPPFGGIGFKFRACTT
jgi:hypothetical protein